MKAAIDAISEQVPMELVAIDVKAAMSSLGDIVGHTTTEDLLDHIFQPVLYRQMMFHVKHSPGTAGRESGARIDTKRQPFGQRSV